MSLGKCGRAGSPRLRSVNKHSSRKFVFRLFCFYRRRRLFPCCREKHRDRVSEINICTDELETVFSQTPSPF